MITIYSHGERGISKIRHTEAMEHLPAGTTWIDIDRCETDEIAALAKLARVRIPPLREVHLLDQTKQYYHEGKALYVMTPTVVGAQSGNPTAGVLLFIITPQLVITLRQAESRALTNFADSLNKKPELLRSSSTVFVGLIEAFIARLADLGEIVNFEMEQVSRLVFVESLQRSQRPGAGKPDTWRKVLQGLGTTARLNHRVLATLSGLNRMAAFLQQNGGTLIETDGRLRLGELLVDVNHLSHQSEALVNEANFLLDAIVGAISIEQNNVIKIFSMVSVILMPPTMVASIYGMNFTHMPELTLVWAYPAALVLMLISAILPWYWFKRNGWF